MTRLPGNVLIEVVDHDQPKEFRWGRRLHPVQMIANDWRIDVQVWDQRIWRDYFKLFTTTRLLVVLYHDLLTDNWYLYRVYD